MPLWYDALFALACILVLMLLGALAFGFFLGWLVFA